MLRQFAVKGFRAALVNQLQLPTSLGVAGTLELSGQGCWGVSEAVASSPQCSRTTFSFSSASSANPGLLSLRPAGLEIWRNCSAATLAAVPQRPTVFLASVTTKRGSSAAKAKPASGAAKKAPRNSGSKDDEERPRRAKKATRIKKTTTVKEADTSSRASSSARGRAASVRRRASTDGDKVKAALAAAKARAKAKAEKLRATAKALVAEARARAKADKQAAIAKVKAKAEEELQAAVEKEKAKAAEKVARLQAKRVKRAPSAHNLFVQEHMKANANVSLVEATRRFKELAAEERQKYVDRAAAAKAEAQQERKRLAAERAASRTKSAYVFFVKEQRPAVAAVNPGMAAPDVIKRLGEMWRGMGPAERQKYVEMSEADRKAKGLDKPAARAAAPPAQPAASEQEQPKEQL